MSDEQQPEGRRQGSSPDAGAHDSVTLLSPGGAPDTSDGPEAD